VKTKKQIQVLNKKIQHLQLQIAGARKQSSPGEVEPLERQLKEARERLEKLKREE